MYRRAWRSAADGFGGIIMSIGPNTDLLFQETRIPDSIIPRLRCIAQTVRSSDWEVAIKAKWDFPPQLVSRLALAMKADFLAKGLEVEKVF